MLVLSQSLGCERRVCRPVMGRLFDYTMPVSPSFSPIASKTWVILCSQLGIVAQPDCQLTFPLFRVRELNKAVSLNNPRSLFRVRFGLLPPRLLPMRHEPVRRRHGETWRRKPGRRDTTGRRGKSRRHAVWCTRKPGRRSAAWRRNAGIHGRRTAAGMEVRHGTAEAGVAGRRTRGEAGWWQREAETAAAAARPAHWWWLLGMTAAHLGCHVRDGTARGDGRWRDAETGRWHADW